jgi:hypothetical protein
VLRLDPRFRDLDDLCQLQMRAEKLRKQKIAERKAHAIADRSPATAEEDQP